MMSKMPSFIASVVLCVGSVLITFNSIVVNAETPFTKAEINALESFRPLTTNLKIPDFQRTDRHLIKWLRAQRLDTKNALLMLHKAIKWRRDNHVDTILNETLFNLNPLPYSIEGLDKEGRPIGVIQLANLDIRKLLLKGPAASKKLGRYVIQMLEVVNKMLEELSSRNKTEVTQMTLILDAQSFNLRQHACLPCMPVNLEVFHNLENYYPQIAAHLIMINIPRVALPMLELIKPLLSPHTSSVLKTFSTDRNEWQAYLHKVASPDQLSYRYGGTRKHSITSGFELLGLSVKPK